MKVVLSGSGMKYPAHVGGLKRLHEYCKAHNTEITDIAGVSGGAIIATAYASGYDWDNKDLEKLVLDTLPGPNKLIDTRYWVWREPFGYIRGKKLHKKFKNLFKRRFSSMSRNLHIVTVDLEGGKHLIWNGANSPNADVSYIVRASMSIPAVFNFVRLPAQWHKETKHLKGRIINVDGGVANNFPIDMFGTDTDVVGLTVKSSKQPKRTKIKNLRGFLSRTLDTMMLALEQEHIEDAMYARIIEMSVSAGTLEFNVSKKSAIKMMEEGYKAVDTAIKEGKIQL